MATEFARGMGVDQESTLPDAIISMPTAVPAFIGYTPKALYQGKSYFNRAHKISSFAEFQAIYMFENSLRSLGTLQQYHPEYYLVPQTNASDDVNSFQIDGAYYSVLPDPSTIYYFYNCIRSFFANGGRDAYIVSVGSYGPAAKTALATANADLVNPNVELDDLLSGLVSLKNEVEPTLYICPEATLLSKEDNAVLMRAMLNQASEKKTAICIFDVIGGHNSDPNAVAGYIDDFRDNLGSNGLSFGTAYFPFICTALMQSGEIDFTNLFGGDLSALSALLSPVNAPNLEALAILESIQSGCDLGKSRAQIHAALMACSQQYREVMAQVARAANVLPASAAVAGMYVNNDASRGVWHAPAGTSVVGALDVSVQISESHQDLLNVDLAYGKSVNALRLFNNLGVMVWGSRTLDGNSLEWRYLSTRRTVNYIEQSIRSTLKNFVCASNDTSTWGNVKKLVTAFLRDFWKSGGLCGASESDAFLVYCGPGLSKNADPTSSGNMQVIVQIATVRPGEFLTISMDQQQEISARNISHRAALALQ